MNPFRENISVCIPVYNGEKFIEDQIKSILNELIDGDEVLVCDDCSTDHSYNKLAAISDSRVRLIESEINQGLIQNISNLIILARHRYIFLADQDDLWVSGRVNLMLSALKDPTKNLVVGNAYCINEKSETIPYRFKDVQSKDGSAKCKNIIKIFISQISYNGCCMAMKSSLRDVVCPIPRFVDSHDIWFALTALSNGSLVHLDEDLTARRIHSNNLSFKKRNLFQKIYTRMLMLRMLWVIRKCF